MQEASSQGQFTNETAPVQILHDPLTRSSVHSVMKGSRTAKYARNEGLNARMPSPVREARSREEEAQAVSLRR